MIICDYAKQRSQAAASESGGGAQNIYEENRKLKEKNERENVPHQV